MEIPHCVEILKDIERQKKLQCLISGTAKTNGMANKKVWFRRDPTWFRRAEHYFLPSPQKEEDDGNKGQRKWMEGLVVSEIFRQAQAAVRLF